MAISTILLALTSYLACVSAANLTGPHLNWSVGPSLKCNTFYLRTSAGIYLTPAGVQNSQGTTYDWGLVIAYPSQTDFRPLWYLDPSDGSLSILGVGTNTTELKSAWSGRGFTNEPGSLTWTSPAAKPDTWSNQPVMAEGLVDMKTNNTILKLKVGGTVMSDLGYCGINLFVGPDTSSCTTRIPNELTVIPKC